MNLLPTYEQLIAEKLEGIVIPDMADAIWGRIEAALDVEMPVNDTPAPPPGKSFFTDPAVWITSAGILAIIIALFIISRNRRTEPSPQKDQPQHIEPTIKPDTTMKQDFKPPGKLKHVPEKNKGATVEKPVADTTVHDVLINKKTDSLLKRTPVIIAPPAGMADPLPDKKQRKKYGVEVSDSDYRFNIKPKE